MVDIFDEVDEELRADKAKKFLQHYGGAIVGACLAVVAATGAWQGWNWWRARQDAEAATAYLASLTKLEAGTAATAEQKQAALAGFNALAQAAPDGYKTLARLQAAGLKADGGDVAGAAELWDRVAADATADPLLRDLASLLWAGRQLDQGDPSILEARLRPLTQPGNAWRSLAQEQLALLLLRQDKKDDARSALRKLTEDSTAPAGVRGRTRALLDRLDG